MKHRSKSVSAQAQYTKKSAKQQLPHKQIAPVPAVGKPLDGSQYLEVVEEQIYSEQRHLESQQPSASK